MTTKDTILITGAAGFIGSTLMQSQRLADQYALIGHIREPLNANGHKSAPHYWHGALNQISSHDLQQANVKTIIHLAGRAHHTNIDASNEAEDRQAHFATNQETTIELAQTAAAAGVTRLIFLSTIGVHGQESQIPLTESSPTNPSNAYTESKLAAEQALRQIAQETQMDVTIIRPPMVYALHAPGNFGALVQLLQHRIPLPLGALRTPRDWVALDNLIDFIHCCVRHPAAANETFLISDQAPISTTELCQITCEALDRPAWLLPVHPWLMKAPLYLIKKSTLIDKMNAPLRIDSGKATRKLGWLPITDARGQLLKPHRQHHTHKR